MAVSTLPPTDAPAAADPRLTHPLDRLRRAIRRFVVADGFLAAALFFVVWFWAALAADFGLFRLSGFDWVQDAPWALRAIALVTAAVLLAAVFVTRVVVRLTRRFSYPALALVLEKRFPDLLGDRLITAVELADGKRAANSGYSADLLRQTVAEARDRVGTVPLGSVFNWRRLWTRAVGVAVVLAGVLAAVYVAAGVLGGSFAPGGFGSRFADVVGVAAERDVLLRDTPWPRRAHVELVGFPGTETKIGKDAPPPKVRVRAYQWVVADRGAKDGDVVVGWRPLRWGELADRGWAADVPALVTVREPGDWRAEDVARAGVVGGAGMPADPPESVRTVDLAPLTVDEVAAVVGPDHPDVADVFARLDTLAADRGLSRTLRKLDLPDEVWLTYRGKPTTGRDGRTTPGTTRGELKLAREVNGEYAGEVAGLKESVTFAVRADDFRTAPRDIILRQPPMLTRLTRAEFQPAYLYHAAPEEPVDVSSAGRSPTVKAPDFAALKGLRQAVGEKDLSLTGERSVCAVPVGTDLVLTGTSDKPLREVYLVPKAGRVPGAAAGLLAPVAVTPDGDRFTVRFAGDARVTGTVEFDVQLVDTDGIRSVRSVVLQAIDDQAPQVDVAVDVLRKVGNEYLCTVRARVPFVKESIVRDDTGLSAVEFQFTVTRVEAQAVVGFQTQAAAGVWAYPPAVGGLGAALGPVTAAALAGQIGKGEQRQSASLMAPPFERAYARLPKETMTLLWQTLATPPADPDHPPTVRDVKFNLDSDVFDLSDADALLEARGRRMRVSDPGDVQPRFRMVLAVVATDVNVETGPKQGRTLEPIRLLVVSEADLLAEVSKDEEAQIAKLDDALRRLREAQAKLNQQADRLVSPEPPADVLLSARVRAEDVAQDVAKARDLVGTVATEYRRLKREVEVNQCNESVPKRYESAVIQPLQAAVDGEFVAAADGLGAFRAALTDGRRPEDVVTATAKGTLTVLILRLTQIREQLGESLSENRLRDTARKILENQQTTARGIADITRRTQERLFAPQIKPAAAITLAKGEKKRVTHAVEWNLFDKGELLVRVELPAGGEVQGPKEIAVKDDKNDFDYELTADTKPGAYTVRLVPSAGEPVDVRVTVK